MVAPSCGAYCRYSHDDGDDSESVVLQVQRVHEVAKAHGWLLDEKNIFVDDGYSGREMIKRPGFNACLEVVSRRAFPILISKDLDRCARGEVFHVGHFVQTLQDHDVKLFEYLRNSFLTIDGENALMVAFRAYSNRSEALKASERIRDKLLARDAANDGWTGPAPFGFQNQRKRLSDGKIGIFLDRKGTIGVLVQDPNEYPTLLLIGELFLKLGSYNSVAAELNKRKIQTPEKGSNWSSRTISKIVSSPVYRGKIVRGRTTSRDKGGTLSIVSSSPDQIRTYDRPELQVWPDEKLAEIDTLISTRARTTTWSTGERKHLSSSAVRCAHCGASIASTKGGKQKHRSYCCTNVRAGACRQLGYRPEHAVDAGVIMACGMLLTDEVLARTKEIIRAATDLQSKVEARAVEEDRIARDIKQTEKRVQAFEEMAADSDGIERERHRASLREQLARLVHLQEAEKRAKAIPVTDPKAVLASLEAKVDELRNGLRQGGLLALPAVEDILGGDRLRATRRADGRWDLDGEADPVRVFYADSGVVKVGTSQKLAVKGDVTSVTITPVTHPAAISPTAAPAVPASNANASGVASK